MRVTIVSDASHCHRMQVGSYGFWAVSQRGSHAGGGVFKSARDALQCEAKAMVNAIYCALKLGIAENGDSILVQTDCQCAISYLDRSVKKKRRKDLVEIADTFDAMKAEHSLKVEFRYVAGHTTVQDNRSRAQRMSDKRAKVNLEKARREARLAH